MKNVPLKYLSREWPLWLCPASSQSSRTSGVASSRVMSNLPRASSTWILAEHGDECPSTTPFSAPDGDAIRTTKITDTLWLDQTKISLIATKGGQVPEGPPRITPNEGSKPIPRIRLMSRAASNLQKQGFECSTPVRSTCAAKICWNPNCLSRSS
jgi:hypothetical protein